MYHATARTGLLTWRDILPWQRDNEFLLTGYRRASFSYSRSIQSILEIHNETANIWSHLLGSAHFALIFFSFIGLPSTSHYSDTLAVALYQICVATCFLLSTVYHTFSDHCPQMHRFGNQLDHLGIVLVMWSTGISTTHFGFHCPHEAPLRNTYFVALTIVGTACAAFTLRPKFRTPAYRLTRALVYGLLAICLFCPVAHGWIKFGYAGLSARMDIDSLLCLIAIQSTGAAVYAARVPERWFPGAFDLLGHSHNLMHLLVYAGALVRLAGLIVVSERWQDDDISRTYCTRAD